MTHQEIVRRPGSDPVALITGASRGLGFALAAALTERGWRLVIDGRDAARLTAAASELDALTALDQTGSAPPMIRAIAGDVSDPDHRRHLVAAVTRFGRLDLLVNNASTLGPLPRRPLADFDIAEFARVYAVNTVAPLALVQALLPLLLDAAGSVVNISSDAVTPYAGWGGYGSAKAALDHLSAVLAAEHPTLRVHAFDPGDMATELQRQAFPGEDVSDRAAPGTVVPDLLRLVEEAIPSGRYIVGSLPVAGAALALWAPGAGA